MNYALKTFLQRVLPISGFNPEHPLFVITDSDTFFEGVRSAVNMLCVEHQQSQIAEDDIDVHEVEPVRVIRMKGNDFYTPRGYTGVGCVVEKNLHVTDMCLKSVTFTLMTHFPRDARQAFLELESNYG